MSDVQVPPSHYDWLPYNKKARWASYWHQITEMLATGASTCLEIGTGSGIVRDVLVKQGVKVVTVDIDEALGVDRVGDVRQLPADDREFDAVLCSQVLEHIPWPDVPRAVAERLRVCRQHAIVSLPQSGVAVGVAISHSLPMVAEKGFTVRIGTPRRHRFDGQHYWQVGSRGTSRATVRKILSQGFEVKREYAVPEFTYHRFYVLRRV